MQVVLRVLVFLVFLYSVSTLEIQPINYSEPSHTSTLMSECKHTSIRLKKKKKTIPLAIHHTSYNLTKKVSFPHLLGQLLFFFLFIHFWDQ